MDLQGESLFLFCFELCGEYFIVCDVMFIIILVGVAYFIHMCKYSGHIASM